MRNVQYCYGVRVVRVVRVALASVLMLSTALPVSSMAMEDAASAKAQAACERAHFAQQFCQVSPERVAAYKERLRKLLYETGDFDRQWQVGWRRAEKDNSQMSALRDRDPKESRRGSK